MNIDYSKLSENYLKDPTNEDFYYLYWELNLTKKQVSKILNCSEKTVFNWAKKNGIVKTQEMITNSQKNLIIEKYGVDNIMKTKEAKEKLSISMKEVFSENKKDIIEKRQKTWLEKYGYDNPSQNEEIKKKKEQTTLKNYGVKNPQQNKEISSKTQKTFKRKYNGNPLSNESNLKNKVKQEIINKTGYDNPMKNKDIANKAANTLKNKQEEYKRKNREIYGVDYPAQLESIINKIQLTKTKNGTHNTSTEEEKIKCLLSKKFSDLHTQYKSTLYPFRCDFYIPELDLYIEYNGGWTHGGMPYVSTDELCINQVLNWNECSKTSKYYKNAIHTWTIRDVKKRNTAKQNNLNWLEFFSMKEFLEWYNEL